MYKRSRVVSAPVASSTSVQYSAAKNVVELSGREFVQSIVAKKDGSFKTSHSVLRPTDTYLFSWLAGVAARFEKYKFTKLQFTYEPQCPTTTNGCVGMWFDGDPTHRAPPDWNAFINTGSNVHGAPWAKHVFPVPTRLYGSRRNYYIQSEFQDANKDAQQKYGFADETDPLEYFAGCYGFCSVDYTGASDLPVGKVYIDYTIQLLERNVEDWCVTSALGKLLNTELASNSGTGMTVNMDISADGTTTGVPLFGAGCPNSFSGHMYGNQYFGFGQEFVAESYVDLELVCTLHMTLSAAELATVQWKIDDVDSDWANNWSVTSVNAPNSVIMPDTSLSRLKVLWQCGNGGGAGWSAVGASNYSCVCQLKIKAGDRLSIIPTMTNNAKVLTYSLQFSPGVFNLCP